MTYGVCHAPLENKVRCFLKFNHTKYYFLKPIIHFLYFMCLHVPSRSVYPHHEFTVGNHVIFYSYIRTEPIRIFVIISLILNEFSYGKAQIPHGFLYQPLSKSRCYGRCIFPRNLEQRLKVFARGCVEKYSA